MRSIPVVLCLAVSGVFGAAAACCSVRKKSGAECAQSAFRDIDHCLRILMLIEIVFAQDVSHKGLSTFSRAHCALGR
jgi:hypothetical protein